jgi:hypothetical protein
MGENVKIDTLVLFGKCTTTTRKPFARVRTVGCAPELRLHAVKRPPNSPIAQMLNRIPFVHALNDLPHGKRLRD